MPGRRASGYSTDGGASWTRFYALFDGSAPADMLFGNIAVSASNNSNLVWVPSNLTGLETKVYYSRDAGTTWLRGQLNGLDAGQFLHNKYVQARKILVADPVVQGHFYALGSDATGAAILWASVDGGATWNVSWSSGPAANGGKGFKYDSTLVAAGGYLIAAPGTGGGCSYRSRDRVQWEKICSLQGALGMGVGAPVPSGNGNATLYSYGTVDGATGIYRSTDYGTNWQRLSGDPGGLYMGIRAIAGDPEVSRPHVRGVGWRWLSGRPIGYRLRNQIAAELSANDFRCPPDRRALEATVNTPEGIYGHKAMAKTKCQGLDGAPGNGAAGTPGVPILPASHGSAFARPIAADGKSCTPP